MKIGKFEITFERAKPVAVPPTKKEPQRFKSLPMIATRARQTLEHPEAASALKGGFSTQMAGAASDRAPLYIDMREAERLGMDKLGELLLDYSPEISRATWDFLRMCNPGYELNVFNADIDDDEENDSGTQAINDLLLLLKTYYGDPNIIFNRLFLAVLMRGAVAGEIVLDATGRTMIDFVTPDPATFTHEPKELEDRGIVWVAGQKINNEFHSFEDIPTVQYMPLDPLPGRPEGRAPLRPAFYSALFLLKTMRDLGRVIAQQGYPRHDLEIDLEALAKTLDETVVEDPNAFAAAVSVAITEIETVYSNLAPDDTFIHSSTVKVNQPVNTMGAGALAIDAIMSSAERLLTRALKTTPLLMGLAEGTSEANANRQWEIHVATIKSLQHIVENLVGALLEAGLAASGIQARVELRFAELRAAEMLRDAQTEALLIANAKAKAAEGWITNEEASIEVTGHPPAEVEEEEEPEPEPEEEVLLDENGEPLPPGEDTIPPPDIGPTENADPGQNRGRRIGPTEILAASEALKAAAAGVPSEAEIERAVKWWQRVMGEDAALLVDATPED